MTSVNTNSFGIAIARINPELNENEKAQLFGSIALNETPTLEKGKYHVKDMILPNLCPYLGFAEKVTQKFMPLLTKNFLTN